MFFLAHFCRFLRQASDDLCSFWFLLIVIRRHLVIEVDTLIGDDMLPLPSFHLFGLFGFDFKRVH